MFVVHVLKTSLLFHILPYAHLFHTHPHPHVKVLVALKDCIEAFAAIICCWKKTGLLSQ